jgi:hypothetical protein
MTPCHVTQWEPKIRQDAAGIVHPAPIRPYVFANSMNPLTFTYGYEDIFKLTDLAENSVYQHVSRQSLRPESLRSLVLWVVRHGNAKFKQEILEYAISKDNPDPKYRKRQEPINAARRKRRTAE